MKCLTVMSLLFATAAFADTIVSPESFQALSEGKTLHFHSYGQYFGSEQYFANRKSLWKPAVGECDYGYWYPQDQAICFVYEIWPEPICWLFLERDGTYFAHMTSDPDGLGEIELTGSDSEQLDCPGPKTGS